MLNLLSQIMRSHRWAIAMSKSVGTRAQIYDPASGAFVPAGKPAVNRRAHTATLLADGGVLLAGGLEMNNTLDSAERYDPTTGRFTLTNSTSTGP